MQSENKVDKTVNDKFKESWGKLKKHVKDNKEV